MPEITKALQLLVFPCAPLLMKIVEKKGTKSRAERQCIDSRNQNSDGQGKSKLPVKDAGLALKKTYRQKYRCHDQGDGNNCFCYLPHG